MIEASQVKEARDSMNRFRSITTGALVLLLVASPGYRHSIHAAPPGFSPAGQAAPSNEITNFKGKLKELRRGIVIVEKDDGAEAMVMPPESIASFQFVAKANANFLKRGMLVRFNGNFGPAGNALAPITKVTLFQPVDVRKLHGRAKQQFTPGVYSDPAHGKPNQPMMGKLTVVGAFVGVSGNVMVVQAGKVPVRVPVNTETQLEIRYNNLNLAQPGDPVSVSGFYEPPNENQVRADRITITTDREYPLSQAASEKGKRRSGNEKDSPENNNPKPDEDSPSEKNAPGEKADEDQANDKELGDGDS